MNDYFALMCGAVHTQAHTAKACPQTHTHTQSHISKNENLSPVATEP